MSERRLFTAVFIVMLCAPFGLAQEGDAGRQKALEDVKAEQARQASLLQLPKAEGAWVLQVVTGGGVMGRGRGDFAVNSEGGVACAPATPSCLQALAPESLRALAETVSAAKTDEWAGRSDAACHDCYFTTMTLQRRDPHGNACVYLFSWDDLAAAKMPEDVRRLYETALALAGPKR